MSGWPAARLVRANGIQIAVHSAGDGPAVVFCHGFPELAYSWRHQLPALAAAGFHAIAPDQRGYGGTERPAAVEAYDIHQLTADLVGVLDALDVERAVFVGHDWGGLVVWMMPLLHRARTAGVVGVNTPYIPRLPIAPIGLFRQAFGANHYIVHFQEPGVADRALARDVRRVFTRLMRTGVALEDLQAATGGVVRNLVEVIESDLALGAPILSEEEVAVYTAAFERTGFTGAINWYRNMDRNWKTTAHLADARIDVPALMVTAELDPVLRPEMAEPMRALVPDLEITMIPGCGHWTQQEEPAKLNGVMIDWLRRRFGRGTA